MTFNEKCIAYYYVTFMISISIRF